MNSRHQDKISKRICLALPLLIVMLLSFAPRSFAGKDTAGGGGGEVHDKFIAAGHRVLYFLQATPRGRVIAKRYQLNLCRLRATLDEHLVFVFDDASGMRDPRGSKIEGTGFKWRIHIGENAWRAFFERNADIYHLVFKEMLRSEQTHFDTAIDISRELIPFPRELYLDRSLAASLSPQDSNSLKCLQSLDRQEIEAIKESYEVYAENDMPQCQPQDLTEEANFIKSNAANQLLGLVKQTRCKVVASDCRVGSEAVRSSPTSQVFFESIYWHGKRIYSVPFGAQNSANGNDVRSEFDLGGVADKMNELIRAGVCKGTPSAAAKVPDFGTVKVNLGLNLPIAIFLYDSAVSASKHIVKALGPDSRIQLLNRKIENDMIKVRVVSVIPPRAVSVIQAPSATEGDEGYIPLANTSFLNYVNVTGTLRDHQE